MKDLSFTLVYDNGRVAIFEVVPEYDIETETPVEVVCM